MSAADDLVTYVAIGDGPFVEVPPPVPMTEIAWKTWCRDNVRQNGCRKTIPAKKVARFVARLLETDSLVAGSIVTRPA